MTPASSSRATARWWPHARALLITGHLGAVAVLAIPDASGVATSPTAWKNPTVQAELEAWAKRITALGHPIDAPTLQAEVLDAAEAWNDAVATLRAPVSFYAEGVGMSQRWRMFVAPHRHPAKLHVDIQRDGQWQPVYEARSDEHRWRADQLGHIRTRAVLFRYAWAGYGERYRALARWIARRAGEDFPQAERVRIRYYGYRTPTPQEARRGELPPGEFRQVADVALSRYR